MSKITLYIRLLSLAVCFSILLLGCEPSWKELILCDPGLRIIIPTINSYGSDFVILSGNNFKLDLHNSFLFDKGDIEVHLRDINNENVVFEYKEEIHTLGEAGSMPPTTFSTHCLSTIAKDDLYFQTRSSNVLLKPLDFAEEWQVVNYAQAVPPQSYHSGYSMHPKDRVFSYFEGEHIRENASIEVPYYIFTNTQYYESEGVAANAFEERKRFLRGLNANSAIKSNFANSLEHCQLQDEYFCSYIGQHDTYVVQINMIIPPEKTPQPTIPLKDWQYIINLVESKILQQ